MNRPIVMAQLGGSAPVQSQQPARVIKLAKPADGQAQTVYLGYQQQFKLDMSAIANEKITLVHVGERLIILFDKQVDTDDRPVLRFMGAPRSNISFDVNGRAFDGAQFEAAFPITTDQSVLRRPATVRMVRTAHPRPAPTLTMRRSIRSLMMIRWSFSARRSLETG